jgi:hypothetical protein
VGSSPAPVPGGTRSRPWYGSDRGALIAAVAVTAAPLVVVLVRVLIERGFALHGDGALIELRVRDVGAHTPLVGSYQRFGWNQPGPLLFYVFAVPYRLLGSAFAGLEVGALLLNAGAVVGVGVVAFRRGGVVLLLWSLTLVAILVHSLGREVADPWEPRVIVLPCVLLLFLVFDMVLGSVWSLPIAAGVASLLAQAYAGVAPLAVALVAFGAAALLWRRFGRTQVGAVPRGQLRAALLVTLGVVVVLWLPPLIDQVRGDPGNLSEMWRFFREPHDTLGLGDASSAVALQLGHRASWFGADVPLLLGGTVDLGGAPLAPFGAIALVVGLALTTRRRDRSAALALTVLVAVVASVFALSRLVGDVFPWILGWTSVVGLGCWLAAGWCGYRLLPDATRARLERPLTVVLGVALVLVTTASVVGAVTRSYERDSFITAMRELGDRAADETRAVDGPVLVEVDSIPLGGGDAGPELVVLALERAGVDTVVDEGLANRFGDHRAQPDRAVAEVQVVAGGRDAVPAGFDAVATVDPLSRSDRRERERIVSELRGLGVDGSLVEIQDAADRDPRVRRLVNRLGEIEDLPRLTLAIRDRPEEPTP